MTDNLVNLIISDHREVEDAFQELESGQGSLDRRKDLVDHVISELVRHSVAEEQYLYPTAREVLDDGDNIADHEIQEHSEVEKLLKELEDVDPSDPTFNQLITKVITNVRHHVEEEERDLLPRLQAACSESQLQDLGEKVDKAKKMAPTRPHPSSPDKPPANKIMAPGAALVDRMRDALAGN